MSRPREVPDDETFEDFLWEVDVTRRRPAAGHPEPAPDRASATARPQAPEPATARPAYRSTQPQPGAVRSRRRLSGRLLAQLASGVVLVGGTACLVVLALMR